MIGTGGWQKHNMLAGKDTVRWLADARSGGWQRYKQVAGRCTIRWLAEIQAGGWQMHDQVAGRDTSSWLAEAQSGGWPRHDQDGRGTIRWMAEARSGGVRWVAETQSVGQVQVAGRSTYNRLSEAWALAEEAYRRHLKGNTDGRALMTLGNKTGQVCGRDKKVGSVNTVDVLLHSWEKID